MRKRKKRKYDEKIKVGDLLAIQGGDDVAEVMKATKRRVYLKSSDSEGWALRSTLERFPV